MFTGDMNPLVPHELLIIGLVLFLLPLLVSLLLLYFVVRKAVSDGMTRAWRRAGQPATHERSSDRGPSRLPR